MNGKDIPNDINVKNKVEAVLFSVGKRISIEDISRLTGITDNELLNRALNELKADYETRGTSITLVEETSGFWKLTVKDHYLPIVHRIVSKTELDKPLMETLAVIAWKYPVVQSEVIRIRHNKAYDHMRILEEMGFITRQKFGRTKKITLTDKFFEYFDLPSAEARNAIEKSIPERVKEDILRKEREISEAEKKIEEYEKKKQELEQKRREGKQKEIEEKKCKQEDINETEKIIAELPNIIESEKKELKELSEKEEKEIEKIEEGIKELEDEENKNPFEQQN